MFQKTPTLMPKLEQMFRRRSRLIAHGGLKFMDELDKLEEKRYRGDPYLVVAAREHKSPGPKTSAPAHITENS